ncbi:putative aldouronate transport system permease protein [Anaerotaenia torta]|uniref:ABC transporter permease n=1 Tax=Anaerotaenia torta TaxID=433293 RepID=UPI003D1ACBC0
MKKNKKQGFLGKLFRYKTMLLMLLPSAALVLIFSYLPIGGLVMAFKRFNYSDGIFGSPWVGLDNFRFFFASGKALSVTRNTALYNLSFIVINTALEVALAVILSEMAGKWLKKLTQSIIFLPYFISWVIVGSIAYSLLSYETGTLNSLLQKLGADPANFYGEAGWWPFIIIAFSAWKGVGYGVVVYLAAILGVDGSLHEAAAIDGANIFQRIRFITLPSILPTAITLILLALGKVFRGNLDLFYQLVGQNGALFGKTDVIDTYVFRMTIAATDVGQTVAIGFYQSVLCFITILIANWVVKKKDANYSLF